MKTKTINLNGTEIPLTWDERGFWLDAHGTIWPDIFDSPNYCGLSPYETGYNDPFWEKACSPHDKAFAALKTGYQGNSNIGTFKQFSGSVLETMAKGAYAVVMGPLYLLIGGGLGMVRWLTLKR